MTGKCNEVTSALQSNNNSVVFCTLKFTFFVTIEYIVSYSQSYHICTIEELVIFLTYYNKQKNQHE